MNPDIEALLPSARWPAYIGIILAGLILPALLIPIVHLTGYSEIVEEIAKALIVFFLILPLPGLGRKLMWACIFGALFGISETVFYLPTILQNGTITLVLYRLLLTVPMHGLTATVLAFSGSFRKRYILLGLVTAIAIHLAFNDILVPRLNLYLDAY
jgi:hypothetical protein